MHQLIVLGNGFDLACGLHSKYSDFFEERRKEKSKLEEDWKWRVENWPNPECLEQNDVVRRIGWTVWDVILFPFSGKDWCDIESAIESAVVAEPIRGNSPASAVASLAQQVYQILKDYRRARYSRDYWSHISYDNLFKGCLLSDPHNMDYSVARYCMQSEGVDHFTMVKDVYDFFLQEIHSLEFYFYLYLKQQVDSFEDYQENARDRIRSLYLKELPTKYRNDDGACTSVLSFNYTRPAIGPAGLGSAHWTNIHGELGDNKHVIFGIDGTGHLSDSWVRPFTKTYRLMELKSPDQEAIVHTEKMGDPDSCTRLIKFYGHSLGEADYSYFQAIFDGVDLYESRTRLIFYYSPHGDVTSAAARKDMSDKVTDLIDAYADTMTNKAHGSNLLHKLLMEGRLSVEEYEREPELLKR